MLWLNFFCFQTQAQDVEQTIKNTKDIVKQDPLAVSGSINASSVFYDAKGIKPRRDPFYWVINANVTFNLFNKISVPFSATFTQQDKNFKNGFDKFSQPFNQFGLSPKYKWLTVHAGYRSLDFSEYTYSGTLFLGGGVEIKPEKSFVSGSAFYGRLVKAVPVGGINGVVVSLPAYNRMGGGGKVKIGNETNFGELIFFKAKDDKYSIAFDTSLRVTPAENQVIGLTTQQKITKLISVDGSFAYSMYSDNLFQGITRIDGFTYVNQIYDIRPSSSFNKAITASVNFTPNKFRFGFKYKRIDPDYKTMGSIFLVNDVQEYSVNNTLALLNNKLSITSSIGLQQNNLDKIQSMTSKRTIGSVNASHNFTERVNVSLNYSNFSSNTIPVRLGISDTITLVQLTQSGGAAFNYSFSKQNTKHGLNINTNYQESGGNKQKSTNNITASINHNVLFQQSALTVSAGALINQASANNITTQGIGPTLSCSKSVLNKKIKLSASANYQIAKSNGKTVFNNLSALVGVNYTINKWMTAKADYNFLQRTSKLANSASFSENRLNISVMSNLSTSYKKLVKPN